MSGPYTLRPFLEQDIERAAELERICFSDAWSYEVLQGDLELGCSRWLAAADTNNILCAYIGAHVFDDEAEIVNVACAPEHRRKGLAEALIRMLLKQEIGLKNVYLEVRQSNTPAIALYAKVGFKSIGIRRNYYEKPRENAVLMRLQIGE